MPLDGRFRDNVFVQVKNGALDFQPREPFHQLYGALPKTPIMGELQITQEYLGQSTHLVYLAPMWTEFLGADTFAKGPGSLVSQVLDGPSTPIAGPASPAWPIPAATRTGAATISRRPTGTPTGGSRGTRRSTRATSPTSGFG